MTTFSQLIDLMVAESKRPDMRVELCTYLNQTIRECHFDPQTNAAEFYSENWREVTVTATTQENQTWVAPNAATFQADAVVRFGSVYAERNKPAYARRCSPGPSMSNNRFAYYRAGSTLVFGGSAGYGGIGSSISIGYYEFPRSLKYYESGTRPALYDVETGWAYADDYDVNDSTRSLAQDLTTNWLLLRWADFITEGLRAKIYKRLGDQLRGTTSYSLYTQLRRGLVTSEVSDLGGPRH